MRQIDADAMRQDWLENGENEYVYDTNAVLYSIDEQPTIDAVPVVRCKDCALQGKLNCPMDEWVKPDDNGFCHHGKRKDGATP